LETVTATSTPVPSPPAASTPFPYPTLGFAAPSRGKWIGIDLSSQRLTAYEGQRAVLSALVSTGVARMPTPLGDYTIYRKVRVQAMGGPDYYLPNVEYVSYFYRGYALHGTYWHDNFGQPMSHGCVNMRNPDAQWIWDWAPVGTLVRVHP
jgi:lipoprotein-anchoring transpeptidase ErfK/SrfK